ncbi:DUF1648 domain-containing protein [Clostridium sp. NSJ-6]|uniref:DUF1648 domain-containing protein n=2 Tax=Clostridium hominis TaxID=2763036 RepID=A0ABR7DGU0_9CLOT|nr:DUF1648 domain-containing protein [Clostridium hominis]
MKNMVCLRRRNKMEDLIKYFIFPFITVTLYIQVFNLNRFSNNGIYFGVRVPLEYKNDIDILRLEKKYKKENIVFVLPLIILLNILYIFNIKMWLLLTYTFISIGITQILPIIYWKKMKRIKNERGWKVLSKNVIIVETGLRQPKKNSRIKALETKHYLILLIIPFVISILTLINYNKLPELIPVHYNAAGVVDKVVEKGTTAAYMNLAGIPFMLVLMIFFFVLINKITVNSKSDLFSGKIKGTIEKKLLFKKYISIFTWILALETLIIMSLPQVSILFDLGTEIMTIPMVILFISIGVFILISYYFGQGGRNIKTTEEGEENYRDDDDRYILGSIYYNKNDPALMVEKRVGVGWTVNLAHPIGMILMVLPFIIMIGLIIFMYFFEKTNPMF